MDGGGAKDTATTATTAPRYAPRGGAVRAPMGEYRRWSALFLLAGLGIDRHQPPSGTGAPQSSDNNRRAAEAPTRVPPDAVPGHRALAKHLGGERWPPHHLIPAPNSEREPWGNSLERRRLRSASADSRRSHARLLLPLPLLPGVAHRPRTRHRDPMPFTAGRGLMAT